MDTGMWFAMMETGKGMVDIGMGMVNIGMGMGMDMSVASFERLPLLAQSNRWFREGRTRAPRTDLR